MSPKRKTSFSQTDAKLYQDCPRCFYLARKHNIERPNLKKRSISDPEIPSTLAREMRNVLTNGVPLPRSRCPFCTYRQLVRETGIENDLTA